MYRRIELNPARITSKEDLKEYIRSLSLVEEGEAENADALVDLLSEVSDQVDVIVTPSTIERICEDGYAYKVLLAFSKACEENPNLKVLFRQG